MRQKNLISLLLTLITLVSYSQQKNILLAKTPPMGWNSFDSYGVYLHEKAALENVEAFAKKLKPYGYEYFVIDAGWFGEFTLRSGTIYPTEKHAKKIKFNEYGLLQPSDTYFPNGFKPIIDRCHQLGIKFGVHLMRGIPRAAVDANVPIKGTKYFAQDIADKNSICVWNSQNYGVDMKKPGAQEFYDSLIKQLADCGVTIGAHTVNHPILKVLSEHEQHTEIEKSKLQLEDWLGRPVEHFAYPNGVEGRDFDDCTVNLVKQAGFTSAVITNWGKSSLATSVFKLKRFTPWDHSSILFHLRLIRNT